MTVSRVKLLILTSILIALTATGMAQGEKPKTDHDCCSIVTSALQAVDHIKKGMSRAEVEKEFRTEGGLFTREETFYVYRKCPLIKIKVTFERDPSYKDFATGSPKDRVLSVSQPYLQYPVMD